MNHYAEAIKLTSCWATEEINLCLQMSFLVLLNPLDSLEHFYKAFINLVISLKKDLCIFT